MARERLVLRFHLIWAVCKVTHLGTLPPPPLLQLAGIGLQTQRCSCRTSKPPLARGMTSFERRARRDWGAARDQSAFSGDADVSDFRSIAGSTSSALLSWLLLCRFLLILPLYLSGIGLLKPFCDLVGRNFIQGSPCLSLSICCCVPPLLSALDYTLLRFFVHAFVVMLLPYASGCGLQTRGSI